MVRWERELHSGSVAASANHCCHGNGRDVRFTSHTAAKMISFFFFKQKTAYEIGLGIPAEPLFRSKVKMSTVESIARPRRNGERRRAPTASISKESPAITGVVEMVIRRPI